MSYRVGVLPYSHHARAKADVDERGNIMYSNWWGYEPFMIELLGRKFNFRFIKKVK